MDMSVNEILDAALKLSPDERARIADALYEAESGSEAEVSKAWQQEITRRIADIDSTDCHWLSEQELKDYISKHREERREC